MQDKEIGRGNGTMNERASYLAGISLFWLIVGGLLLFFGLVALLQRVGIWSKTDADNAGDVVIILLGAAAIVYALKGDGKSTRRESA